MEIVGEYKPKKITFLDKITNGADWKVLQNALRLENNEIVHKERWNPYYGILNKEKETIASDAGLSRYHMVGGKELEDRRLFRYGIGHRYSSDPKGEFIYKPKIYEIKVEELPSRTEFKNLYTGTWKTTSKTGYYDEVFLDAYIGLLIEKEGEGKAMKKYFDVIRQNRNWILRNQADQLSEGISLDEIDIRDKIDITMR